ncbi:hypothetical protein B0H11DRAFT_1935961 [Mycena galericulata]|nr:hypothetical protein B0H11DRAFT_1935961 [Mycena galericulata]
MVAPISRGLAFGVGKNVEEAAMEEAEARGKKRRAKDLSKAGSRGGYAPSGWRRGWRRTSASGGRSSEGGGSTPLARPVSGRADPLTRATVHRRRAARAGRPRNRTRCRTPPVALVDVGGDALRESVCGAVRERGEEGAESRGAGGDRRLTRGDRRRRQERRVGRVVCLEIVEVPAPRCVALRRMRGHEGGRAAPGRDVNRTIGTIAWLTVMPSTTFTHVEDAILAPPSASDGPGAFYGFRIKKIFKLGRAKEPRKRQGQWARQCRGERHHWLPYYWEVPFYKKFEKIIHLHYKATGAWLAPHRCRFCSVRHQEKFGLKACGGVRGLVGVVEHYLGRLNWPVIRAFTPRRCAPTCGLRLPPVLQLAGN